MITMAFFFEMALERIILGTEDTLSREYIR